MKRRRFFALGFANGRQMGKAVDLETYNFSGFSPESIREAADAGKPAPGFYSGLHDGVRLGAFPPGIRL